NLKIRGQPCLVIGGGAVAARKIGSLLAEKARVTVVSPEIGPGIQVWVDSGEVLWHQREYCSGDVAGYLLVIAATGNPAVNRLVAGDCFNRQILVNTVDEPALCNFFLPAVVRRGDLTIAVSTAGTSPAVARRLREELEQSFGDEYGEYLALMGRLREQVLREVADPAHRRAIFECLAGAGLVELIKTGDRQQLKERIAQCLSLSWD
ncbi:MAG: bifunctional precorrin-2 dehydrogenase/sirohydrochlorin ferrochelatase, partial [Heliobacteriaceae bacterium]|nr:bifunctional precorrin-2 dehydrogenase/sirohydrochlorin ferrochelatase [Heliobacteriaceae bacterium]